MDLSWTPSEGFPSREDSIRLSHDLNGRQHEEHHRSFGTSTTTALELVQTVTQTLSPLLINSTSRQYRNNSFGAALGKDEFVFLDDYYNESSRLNSTLLEPQFPFYLRTTSTLLSALILFIGIVGNILVPIVVWRNKDLRSSTNIFLVNLSVADLLVLLVCMPTSLVELHSKPEVWILGATMCKLKRQTKNGTFL